MSKEMEGAIVSQFELYGRIARSFENLKKSGIANITLGLVEARLQSLESNWAKFEAQHDRLVVNFWEALAEHDYQKKELQSLAEEAYVQQKGLFLDAIRTLKNTIGGGSSNNEAGASHPPRTTLPRIQLPQFSGRFEEWPSFRDLFHSIIGKDTSTTNVEKLHYLKSCLKGEAVLLIRNLPTTEENFGRAWKTLTDHYENKRLLVRSYISQFTALQKLKVIELLDSRSRREWESSISETTEPPSYAALQQFLDRRLQTLESLQPIKVESDTAKSTANPSRLTRSLHARKQDNKRGRCSLCSKEHYVIYCDEYQGKTAAERKGHAEANNLCLNCLGRHKLSDCSSQKTCATCHARHHTSLHEAFSPSGATTTSHLARKPSEHPVAVLLATARIRVADRFGVTHTARALIDQGSESSLISESLTQRLRLPRERASVYGVGGIQTGFSHGQVTLKISPLGGGLSITVSALVFPRLTLYDGGIKAEFKAWKHLQGLELADPDCLSADPVDILLGADIYASILQSGLRKEGLHAPIAQQTTLGWILSGRVGLTHTSEPRRSLTHQCRTDENLSGLVHGFWQQEEMPCATPPLSPEDHECESHFVRTHSRAADGRYIVRLPVVSPLADLSTTRRSALLILTRMEKRFARDVTLRQLYVEFMTQYKELGHMSSIENHNTPIDRVSYLPHHGVMRETSATTKLRVVFNGSTTTSAGASQSAPSGGPKFVTTTH